MSCLKRAVLFFEEDAALPAGSKPLMLEAVLSCPILTWTVNRLRSDGVQRIFVVCGPRFGQEARRRVPDSVEISERWADLADFLDTEEPVLVLPRAAFPMEEAGPGFVYAAPGRELRETWREKMTNNVQGAELVSGWLPVYGLDTVAELEALARRKGLSAPEGKL